MSPALWGTEQRLHELFGSGASRIDANRQNYVWRYRSPQHWLDLWLEVYGPLQKAFAALETEAQQELYRDLIALARRHNVATDGTMIAPADYLEIVIVKS